MSCKRFQCKCGVGDLGLGLIDLDRPFCTDAFSFSSCPRFDHVGPDAKVSTEQRPHAKLFVHEEEYCAVCVHIPAHLGPFEHVGMGRKCMTPFTLIPIESRSRSVTRPIPGIFLIGSSLINSRMNSASNLRWNCPFGLFWTTSDVSSDAPRRGGGLVTLSEQIWIVAKRRHS